MTHKEKFAEYLLLAYGITHDQFSEMTVKAQENITKDYMFYVVTEKPRKPLRK